MASEQADLGLLLHRLTAIVVGRELPLLRDHQIEMWDYVVLGALEKGAAPTQSQLAATVGRDKTRLIPILDRLEARELLHRAPDPADRRNRIITLTDAGRTLLTDCRRDIRLMETDLLKGINTSQQAVFRRVLSTLVHEDTLRIDT